MNDEHVLSPMVGTVVHVAVNAGGSVRAGQTLLALESMKMEHPVKAPHDGIVSSVVVSLGDTVRPDQLLVVLTAAEVQTVAEEATGHVERTDLAEVQARHAVGLDEHRLDAVAKRRARGQRTARENVAGLGEVDGVRTAVLAYDATVRHFSRMFVTGSNLQVPLCLVVLRKAYGLGATAMAAGGMKVPLASVAWPTGISSEVDAAPLVADFDQAILRQDPSVVRVSREHARQTQQSTQLCRYELLVSFILAEVQGSASLMFNT